MIRFFFILIVFSLNIFPQQVRLKGEYLPGSIVIGKAEKQLKSVTLNNEVLRFDSSGNFIFGFDRDDKGKYELKIIYSDGTHEEIGFKLKKRKYNIQRIDDIDRNYVTPPENELERIERESRIIKKVKSKIGDVKETFYTDGIEKPVQGGRITGVFGSQRIFRDVKKSPHNGVDIAKPKGTPVSSMAGGKVVLTGDNYYYSGNLVIIDHGQGLMSMYLHMSKILVKEGQIVHKGEKIGEIGTTGRSTGPHLHWAVQWYSKRIDPMGLPDLKTE